MSRVFSITELRRNSSGALIEDGARFEWTAETQTSPVAGIEFPVHVGTSREIYPGTDEPVEQVVTVEWMPFEVRGKWQDKRTKPGYARRTWDEFEALVRRANIVRIQFQTISVDGIITDFSPTYVRDEVIGYRFQVSPHKRENPLMASRSARDVLNAPKSTRAQYDEHARSLAQLIAVQDASPRNATAGNAFEDLDTSIGELEDQVKQLDIVSQSQALSTAADADRSLRRMVGAHRTIRDKARDTMRQTRAYRTDLDAMYPDPVVHLQIDAWTRETRALCRRIIVQADESEKDLGVRSTKPGARYRPSAGESVYTAALKFYGNAGDWRRIYDANNLTSIRFDGTEELIIPEVAA